MIAGLLKTKAGVLVMTALVCAIFFTLSRLKQRKAERSGVDHPSTEISGQNRTSGKDQAVLLQRAQDNALGKAETARLERQATQSGSSYDEAGNVYRRRPTPEPMQDGVSASRNETRERSTEVLVEPLILPSLRIHGRRSARPDDPLSVGKNPLDGMIPAPIRDLAQGGSSRSDQSPKPTRFVPFGRLIKAELVITLESTEDEMPLVGLVIEPVYNNGKLVIPAGTELHSMARPDRVRDRIISTTTWKMIFPREGQRPNGRQLTFEGIALDREDGDGNGLTWGITDGSYGLRGRALQSGQTTQELMLFAAEALRAASASAMDRQPTIIGSQVTTNAKNAGLAGGQAVIESYANRLLKEIERNGVYIQVPAGKQFYVYPRQVIDPDRADIPNNIADVE